MYHMDLVQLLNFNNESIKQIFRRYDSLWQSRRRKLDSFSLVWIILNFVHQKGIVGYGTILQECWNSLKQIYPLLDEKPPSSSSFCEARSKLDESIFMDLNSYFQRELEEKAREATYFNGRRIFGIDTSRINLPRDLVKRDFKLPSKISHYPQGMMSCALNLTSEMPFDLIVSAEMNEHLCATSHLEKMNAGDVCVYDRGYLSYKLIKTHIDKNINIVMRMKTFANFTAVELFRKSTKRDSVVTITPTDRNVRKWLSKGTEVASIELRLIKYDIDGKEFILGTTLLSDEFKAVEIIELYKRRWRIEEFFKHIKKTLSLEELHGKSERAVRQEVFATTLYYTITKLAVFAATKNLNFERKKRMARRNPITCMVPCSRLPPKRVYTTTNSACFFSKVVTLFSAFISYCT